MLLGALLGATGSAAAQDIPPNGWVVWASNRQDGRHEIYLMQSDGSGVTRLTFKGGKHAGWSPDAKWIAYTYTPDGSTHVVRHNGLGDKKVCAGEFELWLWDKSGLVCRSGDSHYKVNPDTGAQTLLFSKSDFAKLGSMELNPGGITADGRYLLAHSDIYRNGFAGSNGSFKAYNAAVVLDFQDKSKIYFFGSGCEPTSPPAGDLIYHVCGDATTWPDPYRMSTNDLATRSSYQAEIAHADADWGHEYFPRISNDGIWMAYGASTGCHDHDTCDYEIYLHRLGAGSSNRARITNDTSNDQWPHLWVGTLPVVGCAGPADCDDGDPCTSDNCTQGKCVHAAVSGCCTGASQCDDKNACSTDSCTKNVCQHVPIPGCCAQNSDCTDDNPCTEDTCEVATGTCANKPQTGCCAVDTDCDDKDVCTLDTCDTGKHACTAVKKGGCCNVDGDCDDQDPCTSDSCDLAQHGCLHLPSCDAGAGASDGGVKAEAGPQSKLQKAGLIGGCAVGAEEPVAAPLALLILLAGWLLCAGGLLARPGGRRFFH